MAPDLMVTMVGVMTTTFNFPSYVTPPVLFNCSLTEELDWMVKDIFNLCAPNNNMVVDIYPAAAL